MTDSGSNRLISLLVVNISEESYVFGQEASLRGCGLAHCCGVACNSNSGLREALQI